MKLADDQALLTDRGSKLLDLETAADFLARAEGDKELAREMALKTGWTIPNVAGEEVRCRVDGLDYVKVNGEWYECMSARHRETRKLPAKAPGAPKSRSAHKAESGKQ